MTYVTPHLIQAHASLIHAPNPTHRRSTEPSEDWKVTGTDRMSRPDDESVWIESAGQWQRKWLPGEKEAEAQRRIGDVRNEQQKEIMDHEYDLRMKMLGARSAQKAPAGPGAVSFPDIRTLFPSAPESEAAPPAENPGKVTITPAQTPNPELYNTLDKLDPQLLDIRNQFERGGIQEPFDNAMSVALATLSNNGMNNGVAPNGLGHSGGTVGEVFDSLMAQRDGAGAAGPAETMTEGAGNVGGRGLPWMDATDMDAMAGGDAVAMADYSNGIGGMIDMLVPPEIA